jgi:ribonucleotide reductase beta subunit family protein with ferritin-like domain
MYHLQSVAINIDNTIPPFPADLQEPILKENPDRFVLFPIKYEAIWEMYKKAEASFWTGKLISVSTLR